MNIFWNWYFIPNISLVRQDILITLKKGISSFSRCKLLHLHAHLESEYICLSLYHLVILEILKDGMPSVGGEEPFKSIFILHRCNTGGTPFPLCPIGCSSNYPLGKRRLGEQPYYFSSSVITCRNILFTLQEFLKEVQADAYRMALHRDSSTCHFSFFPKPYTHVWLIMFYFFSLLLIEGFKYLSWNCAYCGGRASDMVPWYNYFVFSDTCGG